MTNQPICTGCGHTVDLHGAYSHDANCSCRRGKASNR